MNIKTYIKENRLSIKNISQSPFSIEKYKKEPFHQITFRLALDSQTINREGLIEIFNSLIMIYMMDLFYQCYGGVLITQGQEVLGILKRLFYLLVMVGTR